MIKKILVVVCSFVATISWAQENTSSPYSYYGIGEIKFRGTQDTRAMGDLNIVGDSIHLNLMNPASYSSLKYTTFGIGGTSNFNKLKTISDNEKAQRTSLDYLAVGFPLGKFGVSFGLTPFSAVGYKNQKKITEDGLEKTIFSTGEGNINRVFIGSSYKINKSFSVGLDFLYNFGDITTEIIEYIIVPTVFQPSRENNNSKIKGVSFNTGLLYNTKLNKNLDLYSSFTYSPESKLSTENSRNTAVVYYTSDGTEIVRYDEDTTVNNPKLIIPSKLSFGAGIGNSKKWLVGTEITFTENSKLINRFDDITDNKFENSTKISVGGFYIPKYDSFSSYLSRVVYRAGFRYENTGLVFNNNSINDYGMNFGLGLPVGLSKIDLGFEFGKRGTTTNGLIEENYFNVSVGLSLSDIWFNKRKID